MKISASSFKRLTIAAVVAVGVSTGASADDNSMSVWRGDSYAAFEASREADENAQATNNLPAGGLTLREYQALSNPSGVWAVVDPLRTPSASSDAPSWHESSPGGLTQREYQALSASSASSFWQLPSHDVQAIAAEDQAAAEVVAGRSIRERLTGFFRGAGDESVN